MRENILGLPALQIELCPRRQEFEARLGQIGAALSRQHGVEPVAKGEQMQDVGSRVGQDKFEVLLAPFCRRSSRLVH